MPLPIYLRLDGAVVSCQPDELHEWVTIEEAARIVRDHNVRMSFAEQHPEPTLAEILEGVRNLQRAVDALRRDDVAHEGEAVGLAGPWQVVEGAPIAQELPRVVTPWADPCHIEAALTHPQTTEGIAQVEVVVSCGVRFSRAWDRTTPPGAIAAQLVARGEKCPGCHRPLALRPYFPAGV